MDAKEIGSAKKNCWDVINENSKAWIDLLFNKYWEKKWICEHSLNLK